jgi:hypothetical protein
MGDDTNNQTGGASPLSTPVLNELGVPLGSDHQLARV